MGFGYNGFVTDFADAAQIGCLKKSTRLESAEDVAEQVARSGGVTAALGGDHTIPTPLIRGRQKGKRERMSVLVFAGI